MDRRNSHGNGSDIEHWISGKRYPNWNPAWGFAARDFSGASGAIEVWHDPRKVRLSLRVVGLGCDCLLQIVQRVRRMFDLEANPVLIGRHLSRDARLAKILPKHPGLRVPRAWDGFEQAVRSVLGELRTVMDAPALAQRLVKDFGQPVQLPIAGLTHLFPGPEILAEANLAGIGIPADQAGLICSLAQAVSAGKLKFNSDMVPQNTLARVYALPRLNPGVASYIAMRSFGDPDALPHSDPGLRQAFAIRGKPAAPEELLDFFARFKPWRAYAAMYFSTTMQNPDGASRSPVRPR